MILNSFEFKKQQSMRLAMMSDTYFDDRKVARKI